MSWILFILKIPYTTADTNNNNKSPSIGSPGGGTSGGGGPVGPANADTPKRTRRIKNIFGTIFIARKSK